MSMVQRFLRDGTPAGVLQVVDGDWSASLDGTDSITITCLGELNKGDFVMWADDDGDLHEHEVSESSSSHTSGVALVNATCINSVSELYGLQLGNVFVDMPQPVRMQVGNFMGSILNTSESNASRWVWGDNGVDDHVYGFSIAQEWFVVSFDKKESVRSAIAKVATYMGAEVRAVLTKENGVYVRTLYMYRPMDQEAVHVDPVRRFTFGKNVDGIKRDIDGETLYSAVHAFGAPIKDADGNETGARYECYAWGTNSQRDAYGYRGADGNMHHSIAIYENSQIDNLTDLQSEADKYLDYVSQPHVIYTCDIANVSGVKLGDYVDIVDEGFTPEVRKRARVTSVKQKILAPTRSGTVVIGKKRGTFEEAVVKTTEAAKSNPTSDAHEEAAVVEKLDEQVNDTSDGLSPRVTDLESRTATTTQTGFVKPDGTTVTVDNDGTIHASGGGGGSYVTRTAEIQIDTLTNVSGATNTVQPGAAGDLAFYISITQLAYQMGVTLTDSDLMDSTRNLKPSSFMIVGVNVGERADGTGGNGSLKNVGAPWKIQWSSLYGGYVALVVKLYELNSTDTAVTPSIPELRNTSIQVKILQESDSALPPTMNMTFSNVRKTS